MKTSAKDNKEKFEIKLKLKIHSIAIFSALHNKNTDSVKR
jgi:hypothetical protein